MEIDVFSINCCCSFIVFMKGASRKWNWWPQVITLRVPSRTPVTNLNISTFAYPCHKFNTPVYPADTQGYRYSQIIFFSKMLITSDLNYSALIIATRLLLQSDTLIFCIQRTSAAWAFKEDRFRVESCCQNINVFLSHSDIYGNV